MLCHRFHLGLELFLGAPIVLLIPEDGEYESFLANPATDPAFAAPFFPDPNRRVPGFDMRDPTLSDGVEPL